MICRTISRINNNLSRCNSAVYLLHPHAVLYLPMLRVISGYAQTNLCANFETSILSEEDDVGGLEGVFGREKDATVIYPSLEVRTSWA